MNHGEQQRVLVITNMYPSERNPSFGIFVKNQVDALERRGLKVDLAAISDQRMGKFQVILKYVRWLLQNLIKLLFQGRKYDLIHAHYVFPSGFFGRWHKKLYGTKLIVTAHGGDIDKMARKGRFFFDQTKKILEEADAIIAVGEKLKTDIVNDFQIPMEKVSLINMGVNRQIFAPRNKEEAKQTLNISKAAFHILFVGNLIKAKGVTELIKGYKKLKEQHPQIHLHLIGANKEPAYLASIKETIANENIEDIHFYPVMNQTEIATWMSAADAFVLPSYIEGFGLVALEAMSCHTPVVGSDVGGLSYLLSDGAGILIEAKNADSLAAGVEKLIVDENVRAKLVEKGEEKAVENDEERQIDLLLQLYGKIGAKQYA